MKSLPRPNPIASGSISLLLSATTMLCTSESAFAAPVPYPDLILSHTPEAYWRLGDPEGSEFILDETLTHPLVPEFVSGGELGATGSLEPIGDFDTCLNLSFRPQFRAHELEPSPAFDVTTPFSVELWIKPALFGDTILGKSQSLPSTGFSLRISDDGVPIFRTGNSTSQTEETWNDLAGGFASGAGWNHIVCAWDGSAKMLYVNGLRVAFEEASILAAPEAPFTLGGGFNGSIDEVAFYRRALSSAEIVAHYEASGRVLEGYMTMQGIGTGSVITWAGEGWTLETTVEPLGPNTFWDVVTDASSPYPITHSDSARFFRLTRTPVAAR